MKFIRDDTVNLLYDITLNLDKFSHKQDKKEYLDKAIQTNKEVGKLLSLLVSFYFEFYKNFNRKEFTKINSSGNGNFLKAFWILYFEIDNIYLLKSKIKKLSPEVKVLLNKYVFGELLKELSEDYFFGIIPTYYNKDRMYETISKNRKIRDDNELESYVNIDYEFDGDQSSLPLISFFIKGGSGEVNYIYKKYENVFTNDKKSRKFQSEVKAVLDSPHYILFYYKLIEKYKTVYYPLLYSTNLMAVDNFLDNQVIDMSLFRMAKILFKKERSFISFPSYRRFGSVTALRSNYRMFLKPNICFSEKGIFSIKLKARFMKYPIVDILLDNENKPIGVYYLDGEETKKLKTRVTENVLDSGIKNFYVEGIKYFWRNYPIKDMPIRIKEGIVFTCKMCKQTYSADLNRQGVCRQCFKKLETVAKYNIEDYFELPQEKFGIENRGRGFSLIAEKYDIQYTQGLFRFKKNLYKLKTPYQLSLPFGDYFY